MVCGSEFVNRRYAILSTSCPCIMAPGKCVCKYGEIQRSCIGMFSPPSIFYFVALVVCFFLLIPFFLFVTVFVLTSFVTLLYTFFSVILLAFTFRFSQPRLIFFGLDSFYCFYFWSCSCIHFIFIFLVFLYIHVQFLPPHQIFFINANYRYMSLSVHSYV